VARAARKGTSTALALKRLNGVRPKTARQVFIALIAPAMELREPSMGRESDIENSLWELLIYVSASR
jgi:hypothetical protein